MFVFTPWWKHRKQNDTLSLFNEQEAPVTLGGNEAKAKNCLSKSKKRALL